MQKILLLDGMGDSLGMNAAACESATNTASGRVMYLVNQNTEQFINNTAFSILQALPNTHLKN